MAGLMVIESRGIWLDVDRELEDLEASIAGIGAADWVEDEKRIHHITAIASLVRIDATTACPIPSPQATPGLQSRGCQTAF